MEDDSRMAKERERVDPELLRQQLLELADAIHRLDEEGELLHSTPQLIKLMGNLRASLFEYEVRSTGRLLPKSSEPPEVIEAQRIVEEAAQRMQEAERAWESGWSLDLEEEFEEDDDV